MACARLFERNKKTQSPEEKAQRKAQKAEKNRMKAECLLREVEKFGFPEFDMVKRDIPDEKRPLLGKY